MNTLSFHTTQKTFILGLFLLVNFYGSLQPSAFTYADVYKMCGRVYKYKDVDFSKSNYKFNGRWLTTVEDASIALPVIVAFSPYGILSRESGFSPQSRERMERSLDSTFLNTLRHHIWYKRDASCYNDTTYKGTLTGEVFETALFASTDFSIKTAANKLNEFDFIRSKTKNIPEKPRSILFKNGKMVVSAAIARSGRILIEEGMEGFNPENGTQFLREAGLQVGLDTLGHAIDYTVNHYCGDEKDSVKRDLLAASLNLGALWLMKSIIPTQQKK